MPKPALKKTKRGPRYKGRTPPRPRRETSQETRDALIRAGIELFAKHGLDTPSLDAICAHANKTRGAFYVHFPDRDTFIVAIMESIGSPFLDVVLGSPEQGSKSLRAFVERFMLAVAMGEYPLIKEGSVRPHQLLDACARSEAVRTRYADLIEQSISRLADVVAHDQENQRVREDVRSEDISALLLASIIGAQTMLELRVNVDMGQLALALLRLLDRRHAGPKGPVY